MIILVKRDLRDFYRAKLIKRGEKERIDEIKTELDKIIIQFLFTKGRKGGKQKKAFNSLE